MLSVEPKDINTAELHGYLLGAVAPRPIALASTIDEEGNHNLSPFSFFNVFSANPPIAIFSPARRGRDNTTKHTYENVKKVPEVVINVVNYGIVQQTSLSSTEYAKGVNEFEKAGLTGIESDLVKPLRVKESPAQFECKVLDVKELGDQGGAGNLVICEIIKIHIDKKVLNEQNKIDQHKIDLVGRLGANWYCRTINGLFEVEKPLSTLGIGVDQIDTAIRNSSVLTGNNLGQLGNIEKFPDEEAINQYKNENLSGVFKQFENDENALTTALHQHAKKLLDEGNVLDGWKTLLAKKSNHV